MFNNKHFNLSEYHHKTNHTDRICKNIFANLQNTLSNKIFNFHHCYSNIISTNTRGILAFVRSGSNSPGTESMKSRDYVNNVTIHPEILRPASPWLVAQYLRLA